MKNIVLAFVCALAFLVSPAQTTVSQPADPNTLLWRISGKDLSRPSYLFGTMHLLCAGGIELSDSLRGAIKGADAVYLELDMENMQELMGIMNRMRMNGDTTLRDLLSKEQYDSIRTFFAQKPGLIPFSMLEKFKPMLAASALMEADMGCENPVGMEQLIMTEAKKEKRPVRGLETMAFQMSIFDSIPYTLQARQLLDYVHNYGKTDGRKEFEEMATAYVTQQLDKLEAITKRENMGISQYMDLLLYRRNATWVTKLQELMPGKSLVVAVGAGHLPGDKGVIALLRAAGYTVEPMPNNMLKHLEKTL
ncbi:TraB/GumN family protein [Flaviaesturariibacter amylovorans]|uniref:TraB/GumN family protein n=1 Tax=Flaviaesturariibacter amylovorans TaxID=1084520 RepID=A0ABP8GXH4_9BACT